MRRQDIDGVGLKCPPDLPQQSALAGVSERATAFNHFGRRVSQSKSYSFCLLLIVCVPVLRTDAGVAALRLYDEPLISSRLTIEEGPKPGCPSERGGIKGVPLSEGKPARNTPVGVVLFP